ncbi:MAG: hypothetical protein HYX38_19915 [Rhodospirillales bacterium]|nr:hypothetical protein [Rhodospirillales bacterium]
MKAYAAVLLVNAIAIGAAAAQSSRVANDGTGFNVMQKMIRFDDLAPAGMALQQCWDAIGIDGWERASISASPAPAPTAARILRSSATIPPPAIATCSARS